MSCSIQTTSDTQTRQRQTCSYRASGTIDCKERNIDPINQILQDDQTIFGPIQPNIPKQSQQQQQQQQSQQPQKIQSQQPQKIQSQHLVYGYDSMAHNFAPVL